MAMALVALTGSGSRPALAEPQKRTGPRMSRAGELVTEPELFETTTRYSPALAGCAFVTFNAEFVALGRGFSPNCQRYCKGRKLDAWTLNLAFMPAATFTL